MNEKIKKLINGRINERLESNGKFLIYDWWKNHYRGSDSGLIKNLINEWKNE